MIMVIPLTMIIMMSWETFSLDQKPTASGVTETVGVVMTMVGDGATVDGAVPV